MRYIPLALAGLLVATGAFAQAAPPPPPGSSQAPGAVAPPPPPGPLGEAAPLPPPPGQPDARRPPPPRGASVRFDRGPGFRFDLHCAEADTTRACADIASQLIEKLNTPVQVK